MNSTRHQTRTSHGSPSARDGQQNTTARERTLRRCVACDRGQTTAEYALVLIAAATIAMLIVAWAGNTGAISDFFDTIVDRITSMLP